MKKEKFTYEKSGVNINAADNFVKFISSISSNNKGKKKFNNIGGFGSITNIPKNLKNPKIVACTDGVGTKVEIANLLNKYDTIGIDGKIFLSSKNLRIFFLLNVVSKFAKYLLFINFSLLMVKESIMPLSSLIETFLIFFLSPEAVIIEIKSEKEIWNPLSITLFFSKFRSNGDDISMSDTLNAFAFE